MNSYQFDSLKFATEGLTGYGSTVIMDNANLPSFMKPINQITNAQLFDGGSSKVAEAFNVDGVLYKRFFMERFHLRSTRRTGLPINGVRSKPRSIALFVRK